jgi:hypothetical protein
LRDFRVDTSSRQVFIDCFRVKTADPSNDTLLVVTLDALLCGLVDAPANVRSFESLGGVGDVVRVLRSKDRGRQVR